MMLMACDQSVRGFAIATAPVFWAGDWSLVRTSRFDGGPVKRGDDKGRRLSPHRVRMMLRRAETRLAEILKTSIGKDMRP